MMMQIFLESIWFSAWDMENTEQSNIGKQHNYKNHKKNKKAGNRTKEFKIKEKGQHKSESAQECFQRNRRCKETTC